jgi:membrane protease YdiL (CAAX protease family)
MTPAPEPDAPAIDAPAAVGASERPRRRIARWRPSRAVLGVVVALIASQAVALVVQLAGGSDPKAWVLATSVALADACLLGLIVLFARSGADRLTAATLGIRRTRFWPALGWVLAIYVGVIAAEGLWTIVIGGGGKQASDEGFSSVTNGEIVWLVLALAVVTPIAEELAFRGYLFAALTRWRGPWWAAVTTGVLFGAAHFAVYPLVILPALMVVGFGLCLLFWFTGSLLPSVAMHSLNNAVVLVAALQLHAAALLVVIGAPALAVGLLRPLARERAPQLVETPQ